MDNDDDDFQAPPVPKQRKLGLHVVPPPRAHLLDFGPLIRPAFGAVSADLIGKCTANLLFSRLQPDVNIECKMHFKQNRTGADGVLQHKGKEYKLEVKWSTIQLQTNQNNSDRANYYRWEFGNIHREKFDVIILFGQHTLQATAGISDISYCKEKSTPGVIWDPEPTDLDGWLRSLYVWIYISKSFSSSVNLHCTYASTRGTYNTGTLVKLSTDWLWGGDLKSITERLNTLLL